MYGQKPQVLLKQESDLPKTKLNLFVVYSFHPLFLHCFLTQYMIYNLHFKKEGKKKQFIIKGKVVYYVLSRYR